MFNSIYFSDYQRRQNTKIIHFQDMHAKKVLIHEFLLLYSYTCMPLRNLVKSISRNMTKQATILHLKTSLGIKFCMSTVLYKKKYFLMSSLALSFAI